MISRRLFLTSTAAVLAAPPIVRATSIMKIRAWHDDLLFTAYERHLRGPCGSIYMGKPSLDGHSVEHFVVGAAERLYLGDLAIVRRDGLAHKVTIDDIKTTDLRGCIVGIVSCAGSSWNPTIIHDTAAWERACAWPTPPGLVRVPRA